MVVGKGMMARAFASYADDPAFVVFASGVSNSRESSAVAFEREASLLEKTVAEAGNAAHLVYFGTCSVTDPALRESPYVNHKLAVESWVRAHVPNFTIVRLANVVGGRGNPHLLVNYLFDCIENGRPFWIWEQAKRNLIGVDDARAMVDYVLAQGLAHNSVIEIANPQFSELRDLVRSIERHVDCRASYEVLPGGGTPVIDVGFSQDLAQRAGVGFDGGYFERLLHRYYPSR